MTLTATWVGRAESRPASARYQVEAVDDFEGFLRLEPIWNDLLEQSGNDFPFLTHEWVRTWIEHFGAGERIHVLLVKAGRTVVGIAPLMLQRAWMYGIPFVRLQSIHNVYTERCDFIISGSPDDVYPAIWDHLRTRSPRWHVLELRQIRSDSPTLTHLTRLATADRHPTERWHSSDSPYVSVEGTWETYLQSLDRNHRRNLRNRLGRLNKLGSTDVEVIGDAGQAVAALEAGWALEAAAWKGEAGTAIRCLPRVRAFYEALAARAAHRGWLRLYFLRVDGRRIAFSYALCFRDRMFMLKSGYDPHYASCSPSTALYSRVIERAFRRDRKEIDLLGVNEDWKQSWTSTTRPHEWLFIFRPGLRSRLVHWAKFRMAPALRRAWSKA